MAALQGVVASGMGRRTPTIGCARSIVSPAHSGLFRRIRSVGTFGTRLASFISGLLGAIVKPDTGKSS
jgi:hypothetical protein